MKLLRYFVIAAAAGLALAATSETARADGLGCTNCGRGHALGKYPTLANAFGLSQPQLHRQKLPVFQAAPWYNYWPYDGHFLTPAPISGPFYGPPLTGNFPVNPYFPGPAIPVGFGHAPIPGGPPPYPLTPGNR